MKKQFCNFKKTSILMILAEMGLEYYWKTTQNVIITNNYKNQLMGSLVNMFIYPVNMLKYKDTEQIQDTNTCILIKPPNVAHIHISPTVPTAWRKQASSSVFL